MAASASFNRGVAPTHRPSRPPARSEVRLRETRERNHRGITIECAEQRDGAIEAEFSVHFVRENRQAVFVRDIEQRASNGGRIDGTVGLLGSIVTSTRVRGVTRLRR